MTLSRNFRYKQGVSKYQSEIGEFAKLKLNDAVIVYSKDGR